MISTKAPNSLTQDVLHCQETNNIPVDLQNKLMEKIYHFPKLKMGWPMEEASGFLMHVLPKLPRIINNFKFMGHPFESYLNTCLFWQAKGYRQEESIQAQHREHVHLEVFHSQKDEDFTGEILNKLSPENFSRSACPRDRKKLELLFTKYAYYISEVHIPQMARLTDVDTEIWSERMTMLKELLSKKMTRFTELQNKRGTLLLRLRESESQLRKSSNKVEAKKREIKVSKYKERLVKMSDQLTRTKPTTPHRIIAEITGTPKGTVDCYLADIKNELRRFYP